MTESSENPVPSTVVTPYGDDNFRHLVEALPQLVWISDPTGHLEYISPQMGDFTGTDPTNPGYLDWQKVIHPDDIDELNEVWANAIQSGEKYSHEFRMRSKDGTYHWFSGRAAPVFGADGRITKWYGATTNIDQLKEAEQVLKSTATEKDKFIAILGHELRNPISAISNSCHILVHDKASEETKRKALLSLRRQIEHLGRLVDETLDISRLASGKLRLLLNSLELNHLVENCVNDLAHTWTENKISLMDDTTSEEIWVKADSVRLAQCIYNLLNNAVKFTKKEGAITIGCRRIPGDFAEITVTDNGVGMTQEEISKIFQPFSQGRSARSLSREGLGLGLAITREIMDLHGGEVSVTSEGKGKGSTFALRLPVADSPRMANKENDDLVESGCGPTYLSILLVDDDEAVTSTLSMFLELEGHSVTVAHCGQTALGAINKELPDVVFCDIGLPGSIKGWDVAQRIVSNYPEEKAPYLVALSGHLGEEHVSKCLEAGFDEHIAKPPAPNDLLKALGRSIDRRES